MDLLAVFKSGSGKFQLVSLYLILYSWKVVGNGFLCVADIVSRCLLHVTVLLLKLKTLNPKFFLFQFAFSAGSISKSLTNSDVTIEADH